MAFGKWLPAALVAGLWLGSACLAHRADAATISPASPTVVAGNSFTLSLIDTFPSNSGVVGIDVTVTFDHSLLTLTSVSNGALLVGWDAPTFNPSNGAVSIAEDLGDDPAGTGTVLALTFAATVTDPTGLTTVTIQTTPGPAVGADSEYQLAATSKSITITAASVTPPTTVPEPGTVALLLAPLLAVTGLTRRNRC